MTAGLTPRAFLVVLLALVVGPRASAAPRAAEPLSVVTCNLRYASASGANAWPERRPLLAKLLRESGADVIATQEGLYAQLQDVAADLPEHDWIGLGRDGGSRGEFTAIFFRRERFSPVEFDHFWLSDTPDRIASSSWGNTCRRMATCVRLRERSSGRELYVFDTHLDHEVEVARVRGARLLRERIDALATQLPVVLAGDFNAAAGSSETYSILVGEGALADTWKVAEKRGPLLSTFHDFRGPTEGGARIDWILARGVTRVLSSEILCGGEGGRFPSDHCAVLARIEL